MQAEKLKKSQIFMLYLMIFLAVVFVIGLIVAMLLYKDYSFVNNYISTLGIRFDHVNDDGELVKGAKYPEILNYTFYFCGSLLIPFFPAAASVLREKNVLSTLLFSLTAISGVFIGPMLIGVGIYDVASDLVLHIVYATNVMFAIGVTSILWGLSILALSRESPYKQQTRWQTDLVFVVFILFVSFTQVYGIPDLPLLRDIPSPLYQKMVPISFIPYFSMVGWRLLKILKS